MLISVLQLLQLGILRMILKLLHYPIVTLVITPPLGLLIAERLKYVRLNA